MHAIEHVLLTLSHYVASVRIAHLTSLRLFKSVLREMPTTPLAALAATLEAM